MIGLKGLFKELGNRIVWLLCPMHCPYCDRLIGYHDTECGQCAQTLSGNAFERELPGGGMCRAPFEYKGGVREALHRFKFRGDLSAAASLSKHLADVMKEHRDSFDAVTNVPLSIRSLKKRGYDQTEIIARRLSVLLDKPFTPALVKIKQNKVQHSLRASERERNPAGCYAPVDKDAIRGKRLLLIDDIATTGFTLAECRRVLLEAGAASVECAVVAFAVLEAPAKT